MCGVTKNSDYDGYTKPNQTTGSGSPADVTFNFADVGLSGSVKVYDISAQKDAGTFSTSYTASAVPFHGSAFLRLSKSA